MLPLLFLLPLLVWPLLALYKSHPKPEAPVPYSTFYDWISAGKVSRVVMEGSVIHGTLKAAEKVEAQSTTDIVTTLPPVEDRDLLPLLRKEDVTLDIKAPESSSVFVTALVSFLPWVIIIGGWLWISRRAQNALAGGGAASLLGSRSHPIAPASSTVKLDDVAGLQSAKRDLREVVEFLTEPKKFQRLGGKVPHGVLLVGPPGTGKTLLARAVAGEAGVPFFSVTGSEFIELFVGVGASRVRELFAEARKVAPAILFIDEIDAVGRSRGTGLGGGHDEREQTLNQMLAEMDGFDRNDLTIVLAATNRPDVLDPALLRPGRFDRRVIVDRPERAARTAILKVHTRGKPLAPDVDLDALAARTPGFSGADLANLVNEAAIGATRRDADAITTEDFASAFDKIVLGDPRETKLDAEEKRRVAVHESGHAILARFTPLADPLERVSVIPRGMALGATHQTPAADKHLMTRAEIEARLRVLMGGRASEALVLGDTSSGAEHDLREASKLGFSMVAHYGMSELVGPVFHELQTEHPFLGQRLATDGGTSDATIHTIEQEVRSLLAEAGAVAEATLIKHRAALDRLIAKLLEQETIDGAELMTLLDETTR